MNIQSRQSAAWHSNTLSQDGECMNIRPAEHQLLSSVISSELADRWHVLLLFLTAAASYLVAHCAAAV